MGTDHHCFVSRPPRNDFPVPGRVSGSFGESFGEAGQTLLRVTPGPAERVFAASAGSRLGSHGRRTPGKLPVGWPNGPRDWIPKMSPARKSAKAKVELTKCPQCGSTGPFEVNVYRMTVGFGSVEQIDRSGKAKWLEEVGGWKPWEAIEEDLWLECSKCQHRFDHDCPTMLDRMNQFLAELS